MSILDIFRKDDYISVRLGKKRRTIRHIDNILEVKIKDTDKCRSLYVKRYIKRTNDSKVDIYYDKPEWFGHGLFVNEYKIDPKDLEEWGKTESDLRKYLNFAKSGWYSNGFGKVQYHRLESNYQMFVDIENDIILYIDDYSKDYELVCMKKDGEWVPMKENAMSYFPNGEVKLAW